MKLKYLLIIIVLIIAPVGADLVTSVSTLPTDSIVSSKDSTDRYFYFNSMKLDSTVIKLFSYSVFLFDKTSETIRTISTDKNDVDANAFSSHAFGNNAGTIAVFHSWATNLVTEKTRGSGVYIKTITTGDIKLIEPNSLFPVISGDGRWVVYENLNYDGLPSMILYEVETGKKTFIDHTSLGNTVGGWMSQTPTINTDGTVITYITSKEGHFERWQWSDDKLTKVGDVFV